MSVLRVQQVSLAPTRLSHLYSAMKASTVHKVLLHAQHATLDIDVPQAQQRRLQLRANVRLVAIVMSHPTLHTAQLALLAQKTAPSVKMMDALCAHQPNTATKVKSIRNHARRAIGVAKEHATHMNTHARPAHTYPPQKAQRRAIAVPAWKATIAQRARPIVTRCARPGTGAQLAQGRGMSTPAHLEHSVARLQALWQLHNAKRVQLDHIVHRAQLSPPLARWVLTTHLATLGSWATALHAQLATPVHCKG